MIKMDLHSRVKRAADVLRDRGITQAEVAEALDASQSQISRILSGKGLRRSRLQEDVCLFAERLQDGVSVAAVKANAELIEAVRSTWDGTQMHAKALSAVIRSLVVLRPVSRSSKLEDPA